MPQRAHLLDALGRPGVACVVILFYLLLAVAITVGELGPATLQTVYDEGSSKPCVGDSCSVTSSITLSGLATYNQLLAVSVKLDRPFAENSNEPPPPALEQYRYFPQSYVLSCVVRGSGAPVVISPNVTHTAQVTCNAGSKTCEAFLLAYYPQVIPGDYDISVTWLDPLRPFLYPTDHMVRWHTTALVVPVTYTSFQLGWRYFFVSSSALVFIAYTVALCLGPPGADLAERRRSRCDWTLEQRWVWSLALLLPLFNDPLFGYTIFVPSFGGSVFSALCTVSFLTVLLVYFLVHFHVAALQSEGGQHWAAETGGGGAGGADDARKRMGVLFWLPKIIFGTAFWIISLSAYLWTRYQQIQDPAYSLFEALPAIGDYFYGFLYTVATLYLLYLGALLLLGCRNFSKMRASNRVFIGVTLSTLLILIVGVYLDVFSPLRTNSASYLVVYGSANFYVWLLIFAYLPDRRETLGDVIDAESGGGGGGGAPGRLYSDTTGVMDADDDVEAAVGEVIEATALPAPEPPRRSAAPPPPPPPRRAAAALAAPRAVDEEEEEEEAAARGETPPMSSADAAAFAVEDEDEAVPSPAPARAPRVAFAKNA